MLQIPIQPVPNQIVKAVLNGQNCQISISQKSEGVFVDINADGIDISVGTLAYDIIPLIASDYSGFDGNLLFVDTQGSDAPAYAGMNSRYFLIYLTSSEYALIQ